MEIDCVFAIVPLHRAQRNRRWLRRPDTTTTSLLPLIKIHRPTQIVILSARFLCARRHLLFFSIFDHEIFDLYFSCLLK
jgi:hypothetical protein